ncbi:MAG: hypothetical protein QOH72_2006, partial [Solirubrobacteraceae bacterium]|nr:hypothetical protein [Solirubrobacteraceae bacterium]
MTSGTYRLRVARFMSREPGATNESSRAMHRGQGFRRARHFRMHDRAHRQDMLITRLREEAAVREEDLAVLRTRLAAAEHELEDLRAIRDALTPPELPERP